VSGKCQCPRECERLKTGKCFCSGI
jgi:hypothetical protein